ncbi:hypothetical protein LTR37_019322 [Vermiconidia calcicola]|uniref:Uncharacterized protein n=1 Tax=Vermiconidia calcicola TaxID=1690605 RepID=A0ACC3MHH0_9PEZI|nr:hypothetical protein LTR37_019322 [Vermiconidia calcicola]
MPPNGIASYATATSSVLLRALAYVFLRWVNIDLHKAPEGHHFLPILLTLFAVYVPSFIYTAAHTEPYDVISDDVEIITKEPVYGKELLKDVDPRYVNGDASKEVGQELDVQETIVVEEKDPAIAKTLLTGLPSPSSLFWTAMTFAINLALVAMAVDLVYRAKIFYPSHDLSMARVGFVSDTTAKILVREPDLSRLPIFASYRYADPPLPIGGAGSPFDTTWKAGGSLDWLDDSTDYTGTLELRGLKPDTRYQYVANNHSGYFITAPKAGRTSTRLLGAGTFTFLHSSCLKNNLPYNPFAHPLSNQGLKYLSQALGTLRAHFMLFLGDFIYIDVPRRHGVSAEDYRREYRQLYSSPDWPDTAKSLPWIHVYDDHEIANDWDGNTTGIFEAANDPYKHYHMAANPPAVRAEETYFSFTQGPATFFMLDTRRYRSPNDGTNGSDPITGDPTKSLLGEKQLSDLLAWLKRDEQSDVRWKILVSSVPFTKNWWLNAQDTWRGYLGERQIILEAMWDVGLRGGTGVIVLSGDRHEFAATAFPPPPDGKEEIIGLGPIGVGANALGMLNPDPSTGLQTRRKRWPLSSTVHEFSAVR